METDFDQKRELAQHFIQCYLAARQGLTKLGILRSERNLQGDYAEWLVAELLRLRLTPSTIQKGFDATDKEGQTYQIKSRIVKSLDQNTSFDFADIAVSFNYLVCVFFSPKLELLGVARVPYKAVRELGVHNAKDFRFRWHKRTASDPRVEKVVWMNETQSEQQGLSGKGAG